MTAMLTRIRSCSRLPALLCVLAFSLSCAESGASTEPSQTASFPGQPIVREILGQIDNPPGAQNRRLTLVKYTIAPGAELVPHVHPGVQMASLVSGTLTYRVISGTATVHRQVTSNGVPRSVEELVGPADTELRAGDLVIETESMRHFGANRTAEPVVILATLVTDPNADLSVPVPSAQ